MSIEQPDDWLEGDKRDWWRYLRESWPILLVLGTVLYHLGGRLETPGEKETRIRRVLAPLSESVSSLTQDVGQLQGEQRTHERLDGHYTMIERVKALERRIERLEAK